jgi:hypothetical protein
MLNRFNKKGEEKCDDFSSLILFFIFFVPHNAISMNTSKCRENENNERQRLIHTGIDIRQNLRTLVGCFFPLFHPSSLLLNRQYNDFSTTCVGGWLNERHTARRIIRFESKKSSVCYYSKVYIYIYRTKIIIFLIQCSSVLFI